MPAPRSKPARGKTAPAPAPAARAAKAEKSARAPVRADAGHVTRLSTEHSPYYQIWVLTNLTAKPFAALFGQRFHLNLTEWRVLLTVADLPGVSAQALADYTGLDKMSVSRVVRSLEAQGRMVREGSESDRRMLHLYLTEEGWKVYEAIVASAVQREAQIYAGLSAGERQTLQRLLRKLLTGARSLPQLA